MNEALNVEGIGGVELSYSDRGSGLPVLVLHGGAGPMSVAAWADLLARTRPARVIVPTHPGFAGTPRPESLATIGGLAKTYSAFLDHPGLDGVTVIGNSVGGWIAAELALLGSSRVGALVLADATGIEVPGHSVADVFAIPFADISRLSYRDPARFRVDPAALPAPQKAMIAANLAALKLYAGSKPDPSLRARLSKIQVPTLVVWGESDGIADVAYGRAYAQAIPGASFELMRETGHLPQIETPDRFSEVVWPFAEEHASVGARHQ